MTAKNKGLLEVHLAVFLWGFAGLFPKQISLPAIVIVAVRMLIVGALLRAILFYSKKKGRELRLLSPEHAYVFVVCGFLMAVNLFAYYQAVQISTVAIGVLSAGIFPVFVTILEPIYFKDKFHARDLALALLAFTGLVIISPNFDLHSHATQGVLWGLLAATAFANLTVLNRKFVQEYSSLTICYYQDLLAGIILSPSLLLCHYTMTLRNLLLILVAAVVLGIFGETMFIKGMRHVKAQVAGIIANLEPCYGVLLAFSVLGEVPTVRTLIGGVLVIGAAAVVMIRHAVSEATLLPG